MKRLIALLLPFALAACQSPRATPPQPTWQLQGFDDNGHPTATLTDNSGQSQSTAGNSRITDTGASTVAGKFADKSDPTTELAWFDINRAAEDQPDVAIDLALANEQKSALENIKAISTSANPTVAALNLATEGLKAVKEKIAAREREKAARGKADTSAFRATAYLQGPGAVLSVATMAGTMGSAVANSNQNRAQHTANIDDKQTDITKPSDYEGVNGALRFQVELKKLELELEKAKHTTPATGTTPAKPTEPAPPVGKVEGGVRIVPGPAVGKVAPGVDYSTVFLWKPKNDSQPNNGSILVPAWMGKANVTVNGKALNWMHTGSSSQDRDKYLTELGGTYGRNVKVEITGPDFGVTLTIPDGGDRFEQVLLDARKEGGTDGDEVEPDDPEPTPTPTNSAVRAVFDGTLYAFISPDGIRPIEQPAAVDFFHWTGPGFEDTQKIGALRLTAPGFWTTPRAVQDGDFFELKYVNGSKERPFYENGVLQIWSNGKFRVPGSSKPATE